MNNSEKYNLSHKFPTLIRTKKDKTYYYINLNSDLDLTLNLDL